MAWPEELSDEDLDLLNQNLQIEASTQVAPEEPSFTDSALSAVGDWGAETLKGVSKYSQLGPLAIPAYALENEYGKFQQDPGGYASNAIAAAGSAPAFMVNPLLGGATYAGLREEYRALTDQESPTIGKQLEKDLPAMALDFASTAGPEYLMKGTKYVSDKFGLPEKVLRWKAAQQPGAVAASLGYPKSGAGKEVAATADAMKLESDFIAQNPTQGITRRADGLELDQLTNNMSGIKEAARSSKDRIIKDISTTIESNRAPGKGLEVINSAFPYGIRADDIIMPKANEAIRNAQLSPLASGGAEAAAIVKREISQSFLTPRTIEETDKIRTFLDGRIRELKGYDDALAAGVAVDPSHAAKIPLLPYYREARAAVKNAIVAHAQKVNPSQADELATQYDIIHAYAEHEPMVERFAVNKLRGQALDPVGADPGMIARTPTSGRGAIVEGLADVTGLAGIQRRKMAEKNLGAGWDSIQRMNDVRDMRGAPQPFSVRGAIQDVPKGLLGVTSAASYSPQQSPQPAPIDATALIQREYPSYNPSNGRITSTEDKQRLAYAIETTPHIPREKKSRMYADAIVGIVPTEVVGQAEQNASQLAMPDTSSAFGAVENGANIYGQPQSNSVTPPPSYSTMDDFLIKKMETVKGVDYERSGL